MLEEGIIFYKHVTCTKNKADSVNYENVV
jgi:hypothetical protein